MDNIIRTFWKYKILFIVLFITSFCFSYVFSEKFAASDGVDYMFEKINQTPNIFLPKAQNSLKSTQNYTAFLVMGIDSREVEFDGFEFKGKDRNIDSIIQIVYNHETNRLLVISIPRDTGVLVDEDCLQQDYNKSIHLLYKSAQDQNCDLTGVDMMKKYTTAITGFDNHYFALISFDTFHDIIEAIGQTNEGKYGLWIEIPESVYENYPEDDEGYVPVYIPKGYQFLDSQMLLRYARSRQNTSDFVRSRRQQVVLKALVDQIINLGISDPIKVKKIYESFRSNALYSQIDFQDLMGLMMIYPNVKSEQIDTVVLDDEFGGFRNFIVRPSYSPNGLHTRPGFYLSPVDYKNECCIQDNYKRVKNHLKAILHHPFMYQENSNIGIFTGSGDIDTAQRKANKFWQDSFAFGNYEIRQKSGNIRDIPSGYFIDISQDKIYTTRFLENELGLRKLSADQIDLDMNVEAVDIAIIFE